MAERFNYSPNKENKFMSRRKNGYGCLGMILVFPFSMIGFILDYAFHHKPTPIVGGKRGRKRKKWL